MTPNLNQFRKNTDSPKKFSEIRRKINSILRMANSTEKLTKILNHVSKKVGNITTEIENSPSVIIRGNVSIELKKIKDQKTLTEVLKYVIEETGIPESRIKKGQPGWAFNQVG
jgi:hypothetical protein